jgi:hypothetical protein
MLRLALRAQPRSGRGQNSNSPVAPRGRALDAGSAWRAFFSLLRWASLAGLYRENWAFSSVSGASKRFGVVQKQFRRGRKWFCGVQMWFRRGRERFCGVHGILKPGRKSFCIVQKRFRRGRKWFCGVHRLVKPGRKGFCTMHGRFRPSLPGGSGCPFPGLRHRRDDVASAGRRGRGRGHVRAQSHQPEPAERRGPPLTGLGIPARRGYNDAAPDGAAKMNPTPAKLTPRSRWTRRAGALG